MVFLDNISTLFSGVKENEADSWREMVDGWLLSLRRRGIAAVLVAHAGRNGQMRGTSKREDAAFFVISLDDSKSEGDGAKFIARFTKCRNALGEPPCLEWHFKSDGDKVIGTHKIADKMQVFLKWVEDGLESATDIAQEMGMRFPR